MVSFFDLIIIVIGAIFLLRGLIRGAIKEIFSFLSLILSIFLAGKYYLPLANLFFKMIKSPNFAKVIAFVFIFILVALVITLMGRLMQKMAKFIHLGSLDRLIGGGMGIAEASLIIYLIVLLVGIFPSGQNTLLRNSKLSYYPVYLAKKILVFFPREIKDTLGEKVSKPQNRQAQGRI